MPKPMLKDKTRIKVCLLLKLLENESHSNIANLLNQHVKEEEVTPRRVSAIKRQLETSGTPYNKYEWQLCLSKSAFKSIVEEDKPVQEKLLELATRSEINIRNQKQHKQDETPEMNNYQQYLESQNNLAKSNQRFVKELNSMNIYGRLRERSINRLGKFQIKEIKKISYEEIHFIMDNKVLILRKGDKDVIQPF